LAVNTIVNDDGILTGYNTDAAGFLRALKENKIEPGGANTFVLGAGGASRGISFLLADSGADLTILNRSRERAENLANQISSVTQNKVNALALNEENLALVLGKADILVNTTSIGMAPDLGATPVPPGLLRSGLVVFDIVYNPVKTRLLACAEAAGARTIGGLEMLVWQGALAFTLWTGQEAPVDLMRKVALKALGHEE
jgi:shikimate dehydrogenase